MNLSSYHLKSKYREVLDNLSDEDKIKTTFEITNNINLINDALTYYELKETIKKDPIYWKSYCADYF
jgi:hypothetical protein